MMAVVHPLQTGQKVLRRPGEKQWNSRPRGSLWRSAPRRVAVAMSLMNQVAALREFFKPPLDASLPLQIAMMNEAMAQQQLVGWVKRVRAARGGTLPSVLTTLVLRSSDTRHGSSTRRPLAGTPSCIRHFVHGCADSGSDSPILED